MPPEEVTERPLRGEAVSAALRFCGRSEELKELTERCRLASDVHNPSPQVVVVKAEPGFGKTRLVLEFYRRLREEVDKEGYWPDALGIVGHTLAVNPELENCKIRDKEIPYLWWGVRPIDGGARDVIAASDGYLAPHLVALLIRENVHRTGKAVALAWAEAIGHTIVSDLPQLLNLVIPYYGLALALLKVAYKTQDVVREGIVHGGLNEALEKPRSRADRVLEDLKRTFNPKSISFAKTPGIVFIDDAQFAATDATLLSFAERLIHMAVTQEWPMMIIATHWRQEFAKEGTKASSFAGIIRHARIEDKNYCEIDLRVVDDLSVALRECLPGVTEVQASAILQRVGGNPKFLEQVISLLLERKKYFEGRDVSKALTAAGLTFALETRTRVFDVMLERLNGAPAEVQEAICLVSMQGIQFSHSIAEEFARAAINRSVREPLAVAENPYSMVTGHGSAEGRTVGEFADHVWYLVATDHRESLSSLPDDGPLQDALKNVLSARLADPSLDEKLDIDDCALTYRLAASVFDKSDRAEDKARALLALAHRVKLEQSRYSFETALDAASRFAALFATAADAREMVPAWAVHCCVEPLRSTGRLDEAAALLNSLLDLQRDLAERRKTPEALSDLARTLNNAGVLASDGGDDAAAGELNQQSLDIRRDLAAHLTTPEALSDLAESLHNAGYLARNLGHWAAAAELVKQGLDIRRDLAERLKSPEASGCLAQFLNSAGVLARDRGDDAAAAEFHGQSLDIRRDLAERLKTPAALGDLAESFYASAVQAGDRGDDAAAAELFKQSLDIRRDLAERLKTPDALSDLAKSLSEGAMAMGNNGDRAGAAELSNQSLEIRRDLAERLNTPDAVSDLAEALVRSGMAAHLGDQTAAAAELYKQSLDIRRDLAERLKTPNALRDLGDSLGVSGNLAQELGDYEVASELYKRELDIWRDLAERLNIPAALSAYSNSLSHMTAISVLTGDFTTAMTYCSAGQEIASRLPANLGESLIPEFERLYQEIKKRQAYDSH